MSITENDVKTALSEVIDPNTQKDFVTTKSVKNIKIEGGQVTFELELGYPAASQVEMLRGMAAAGDADAARGELDDACHVLEQRAVVADQQQAAAPLRQALAQGVAAGAVEVMHSLGTLGERCRRPRCRPPLVRASGRPRSPAAAPSSARR